MKKIFYIFLLILTIVMLGGCEPQTTLEIISGSENKSLESIIKQFAKDNNMVINMHYKGSVDMMQMMQTGDIDKYDAVWPANSLWIAIGDTRHKIKHEKSIMTSPIVFGIQKSKAENLGFTRGDVYTEDILKAIESGNLEFIMTSATQSNSGACAYLGFLSALSDNPTTLTTDMLDDHALNQKLKTILGGVERPSGSSGWLKELYLTGDYTAMVNYEAMIIEANQILINEGKEPLYAVYPVDGLAVADSPLGYVNNNDNTKETAFLNFQNYLLSNGVQSKLSALGRRTGVAGVTGSANSDVFNPDWGIDTNKIVSGITMPAPDVIKKALSLYQTALKKPSAVVYCLDYSGSMAGDGEIQMKEAMKLLLDQQMAATYMIQASKDDLTYVIPFNEHTLHTWETSGNDQSNLDALYKEISNYPTGGGTDIYAPAIEALDILKDIPADKYNRAVVLLTDGETNNPSRIYLLKDTFKTLAQDIPVFSIAFGDASTEQLEEISHLTLAKVFDGRKNLTGAFKKAKGYQ